MESKKVKKVEKLIVGLLAVFILLGIATNYKVIVDLENLHKEVLISEEEKAYIQKTLYDKDRDAEKLEMKYLKVLQELQKKEPYDGLEEEIARVYYFLGYNQFLEKNYKVAEEYLEKSISIFDKTKNYFYILNGNNVLINIAYATEDYVKAVNRASKTYKVLQNPNIEGISKKGQIQLKANILAGLINTTVSIGMETISKAYYEELVDITKDTFFENDVTSHAKYYYNLVCKNYPKAKENALNYIKLISEFTLNDEAREQIVNSAHIYLLRVLVHEGTDEQIKEVYLKVQDGYEGLEKSEIEGNLKEIEGIYYKNQNNYQMAYKKYNEAIEAFEKTDKKDSIYEMCIKILGLNDKNLVDINKYLEKLDECKKVYNKEKIVGELADEITKTSYEKNNEDKYLLLAESENKEKLIKHSKNINIMYIFIILGLGFMAKRLKKEVVIREAKEKELENMINIDYLTKAKSKQYIFRKINTYIKERKRFSLIIFDLDNFKSINDNYGHTFGDEVLVNIVETINMTIKENGIIGRFGGEEFIILLEENVSLEEFIVNIQTELSKIKYSVEGLSVTISGGAVVWNDQTSDEIIYEADILLYKAKEDGKNKILIK
ncbi:MAG: GGDEF domain-containing protein [Sarcina sp.]